MGGRVWDLVEGSGVKGRGQEAGAGGELRHWQDSFLPQVSLSPLGSVVKCPLLPGAGGPQFLLGGRAAHCPALPLWMPWEGPHLVTSVTQHGAQISWSGGVGVGGT